MRVEFEITKSVFGSIMGKIRTWLDQEKRDARFETSLKPSGNIVIRMNFIDRAAAAQFKRDFARDMRNSE
jgi:hypothetical protein